MNLDFEVADGRTFRDLCGEVIQRTTSKKDQVDTLLAEMRGYIKNINDAAVFLPRIKEFLEVGIKNDDQLVKLVGILQKLQSTQLEASGGEDGLLSDAEKEELLQNALKGQIAEVKKAVDVNDIPALDIKKPTP